MGSIFKTPKYRPDPEMEKQKKELADKEELLGEYRKKDEERMMAEMYKKRMDTLIEAGLSEEDAEALQDVEIAE